MTFFRNFFRRPAEFPAPLWGVLPGALMIFLSGWPVTARAAERPLFAGVQAKLIQDGFDRSTVEQYYRNARVNFEVRETARFFRHSEARLNYQQFLKPAALARARAYLKKHRHWLDRAQATYDVEKEIITAILLVETRLGTYLGNHSTFNILSTMAALTDPVVREAFWHSVQETTTMTHAQFQTKAKRKSGWAYNELKAFLTYVHQENIPDPTTIRGSYAGAVGIPQFMPSNILALAVDGDQNGRIDLFSHADAIFSVAKYLHRYGWKPGLNDKAAAKVLFRYNHSRYYVQILLKIADRLQEESA